MNKVVRFIKTNKLLTFVIFAYISLMVLMPDKALASFQNSIYYVKEMLMIMPVILLLTALITAWVPRKTIEKNMGKGSGIKGSIFSFLLGSFSAGPIYAAFPVCKALLSKGASIYNIIVLLSTWAVVKVPMLLNESKFLGPKFMIIRWILTTISIFIMGFIASKLVKKEDIPWENEDDNCEESKLKVSEEYCIGCGICAKIAPEYFEILDKKAKVINQSANEKDSKQINEATEKCPSKAISLNKSGQA